MDRANNEDRLSAYFDGELPSNERSEMEDRLRESPELRRILDEFQSQRQGLVALACPALSVGFADRVMERVLAVAAAGAPVTPPPFVAKAKPRNYSAYVVAIASVAAMVALAAFFASGILNPPHGGEGPVVVNGGENRSTEKDPIVGPQTPPSEVTPDSQLHGNTHNPIVAENGNKTGPEENSIANNPGEKVIEPLVDPNLNNPESIKPSSIAKAASTNAKSPNENANSALVSNSPKSYAAATTKSRPKAYRAQIGTRSEFEARLKLVGVSVYYGKRIDPPTSVPRAQPVELMPDPEYVVVEGSEAQLAELVEKLGAQADLMLLEPKGDLEAEMLIEALCRMDGAATPVRPTDAKEGEFVAFTIPAKSIMTLLPATLPTGEKPGILTDSSKPKGEPNLAPRIPPKTTSGDESSLYVPRVIFILDVRMGEAEGASSKK